MMIGTGPEDLYTRFKTHCLKEQLIEEGDRLLVAVSGGSDSMALLHLLYRWSMEGFFWLRAAHFNHKLRPESDLEEEMVEKWCREHSIPFTAGSVENPSLLRESPRGVHSSARFARYQFLAQVAENWRSECRGGGCVKVATGHQQDDQLETVLMRWLSGAAPESWGGIVPRGTLPTDPHISLIRPLLKFRRRELEEYCQFHRITYVHDLSNEDLKYPRSLVRHRLIPVIDEIWGGKGREGLLRTAEMARMVGEELQRRSDKAFRASLKAVYKGEVILDYALYVSYFSIVRIAILKLAIQMLWDTLGFNHPPRVSYDRLKSLDDFILEGHRGEFQLGERIVGRCWKRWVYLFRDGEISYHYNLDQGGEVELPWGMRVILTPLDPQQTENGKGKAGRLMINLPQRGSTMIVRGAREGDRFKPVGLDHPVSLFDLLRHYGVPPHRRLGYPVVEVEGEIAAVPPFRVAQPFSGNCPGGSWWGVWLKRDQWERSKGEYNHNG